MLRAGIHLELGELLTRETVARHHALHREPDDLLGTALNHLLEGPRMQATWVARMPVIELVGTLVASDRDLLGVDHDDEVAGIDVGGIDRFALAAQRVSDLRRQTPESFPGRIDDIPVTLAVAWPGHIGLHRKKAPRGSARRGDG